MVQQQQLNHLHQLLIGASLPRMRVASSNNLSNSLTAKDRQPLRRMATPSHNSNRHMVKVYRAFQLRLLAIAPLNNSSSHMDKICTAPQRRSTMEYIVAVIPNNSNNPTANLILLHQHGTAEALHRILMVQATLISSSHMVKLFRVLQLRLVTEVMEAFHNNNCMARHRLNSKHTSSHSRMVALNSLSNLTGNLILLHHHGIQEIVEVLHRLLTAQVPFNSSIPSSHIVKDLVDSLPVI